MGESPRNEKERQHLEQELLELEFGCHPDPEALRARLQEDPHLRALHEKVAAQAELLRTAAVEPVPELGLRPPRVVPAGLWSRARWSRPSTRLLAVAAGFLLVVLPFAALWGLDAYRLSREAGRRLQLTVSAPKAVPAGAPWSFTVQTADVDGAPRAGSVQWRALDAAGQVLAQDRMPTRGEVTVQLPASLQVPSRVEVVAEAGAARSEESFALSSAAAAPMVHASTDKPVYRPGEPLYLRALVLDRVTLQPLAQPVGLRYRVLDPKDAQLDSGYLGQTRDALGTSWTVPEGAAGGNYQLEIAPDDGSFPAERVPFVVRRYQAPRLSKEIVLDRKTYAPGQHGAAAVRAERLAGGPAAGAAVRAALVLDGREVWSQEGTLDRDGRAVFRFSIPEQVERGAARLLARIADGGVVETAVEPFVVPTGEVAAGLYPEGGDLVAGCENRVYVEVVDPLDRPVTAAGRLRDDRGRDVAAFRTEHLGRGRLVFVPETGRRYELVLDGQEQPFALPEVREQGLVLTALQQGVPGGEPVRLRVQGRGTGPWLVGVFCRGVLVGQATVRPGEDGMADRRVELPVPEGVSGVLRITAFDRGMQPVAERLLQRLPARRIALEIAPERAVLAPGEHQRIAVRATDEDGRPVRATLGLWVTDRAALEYGDEIPGLMDQALLLADVERPEDLEEFLPAVAEPAHVDLLLGTRGWRRFAWRGEGDTAAALQARGPWASGLLAREGFSHTPQVHSNAERLWDGLYGLQRTADERRRTLASVLALALVGLLLALLAEAAAYFARRTGHGPGAQWSAALGTAAGGLLLGFLLFVPNLQSALAPAEKAFLADFDVLVAEGAVVDNANLVDFRGLAPPAAAMPLDAAPDLALGAGERPVAGGEADEDAAGQGLEGAFREPQGDPFLAEQEMAEADKKVVGRLARIAVVREYAHRHRPSGERSDFTETVYFHPALVTGADGTAEFAFDTSDRVTSWIVRADAHGAGRVGQQRATFDSRLPFHLEAKLPVEVSAGDRLRVPVALRYDAEGRTEVELRAEVRGALALEAPAYERLELQDGRGRHLLPLRVTGGQTAALSLTGQAGRYQDRVRQEIRVVPRGFPHRRSWAGTVAEGRPGAFVLSLPPDPVPGSERAVLKVFPSPLASLREGLQGMLREPHGCFEQASSSNYPNTMVLAYVEATGDDLPEVVGRARELLPKGYQKIAGYECAQRGYEWFGGDPGHEALTAYGLLEFEDMGRVHDVDREMVARTRQWLLSRRDGKGGFLRNPRALDSFGGAPQEVTDPYIVYALLYSGTEPAELDAEIEALAARVPVTGDAYELAVIACALQEADRPEAGAARARLAAMQKEDGSLRGSTTSITSSGGNDLAVETTAFAVLAWLPDEGRAGNVRRAVEWLQEQKTARGTFGATQATIMALKALTEYATASRKMTAPGTLRLLVDGNLVVERAFAAGQADALVFDLRPHLRGGEHEVTLELEGGGDSLPWACDLEYHAETPADDPDGAVALRTALAAASVEEGRSVAVQVEVENRTGKGLPMTLAIVGLPAGLEVPTAVLDDLQKGGAFDLWEIDGRELALYWRGLAPREVKRLQIDALARIPGTTTGPASRAYLYYTPDQKRWAAPLPIDIAPLR